MAQKIDITIVVDMLLTGFDSKYLNTLYVDKNLKHHGLIQAFSRTNRVLNGTKPYGNVLDFRQQQDAVDAAIALSPARRAANRRAKSGWWTRRRWSSRSWKPPCKAGRLHAAPRAWPAALRGSQPQRATPPAPPSSKGSAAAQNPARPIHRPHRRPTPAIEQVLPPARGFKGFRGSTWKPPSGCGSNKARRREAPPEDAVDQLDFEFVLFASR